MKNLLLISLISVANSVLFAQSFTFDSYSLGALNGQDGWSAPDPKYQVIADPTGGTTAFSGNVLTSSIDFDGTWPGVARPVGTISTISLDFSMAQGSSTADPEELFVRLNGWSNFVAVKPVIGKVEVSGGTFQLDATIDWDTVYTLQIDYNLTGNIATSADVFLDGASLGTLSGFSLDMAAGSLLEVRSNRSVSTVDNLNLTMVPEPSTYAALVGLISFAFIALHRRQRNR